MIKSIIKGLEKYNCWVQFSGRQTGKSLNCVILAINKILKNKQNITILTLNYHLSKYSLKYAINILNTLNINYIANNNYIKFNDSTLTITSQYNRGNIEDLLIVDEVDNYTKEYFNEKILFVTTPPTNKKHFIYKGKNNPNWGYSAQV